MNLLSGTVLGTAGVLVAPALWQGLVTGAMPVDVALTRYVVAAVACWAALSAVGAMIWAVPRTPEAAAAPVPEDRPQEQPTGGDGD